MNEKFVKCRNCGKEVAIDVDGAMFCKYCGTPLNIDSLQSPSVQEKASAGEFENTGTLNVGLQESGLNASEQVATKRSVEDVMAKYGISTTTPKAPSIASEKHDAEIKINQQPKASAVEELRAEVRNNDNIPVKVEKPTVAMVTKAENTTPTQAPSAKVNTVENNAGTAKVESEFTGGAFALFGVRFVSICLCIMTFGLAYPWIKCWNLSWYAKHTKIYGKQQVFDGTGMQLVGSYIKWWFLTIITLGIYSFWMILNLKRWTTKHTHFNGENGESKFDGLLIQLIGVYILTTFVTIITFGLGFFWAHCSKQRWYAKHTIIDGQRLYFDGTGMQFFGNLIKWIILTVITFGIYSFWLIVRAKGWTVKHTNIQD